MDRDLLRLSSQWNRSADTYFRGWRARRAFDEAGGRNYRGNKVPVENANSGYDGHWRESVFDAEMMTSVSERGRSQPLSAITIQSMADLGYEVDVSQADNYTLPPASKPVAAAAGGFRCRVMRSLP